MEAVITRKPTIFRLRKELLERLKVLAAKNNRSLNNFVETVLMDIAYHSPNATTVAAMEESRDEQTLTHVDMSSFDAFLTSLEVK